MLDRIQRQDHVSTGSPAAGGPGGSDGSIGKGALLSTLATLQLSKSVTH